jgi:hypothetical protein
MSQALLLNQQKQLENPNSIILLEEPVGGNRLGDIATVGYGSKPGQTTRVTRAFWEISAVDGTYWIRLESTPNGHDYCSGKAEVVLSPAEAAAQKIVEYGLRGKAHWKRRGTLFSKSAALPSARYVGEYYDDNTYTVVAKESKWDVPIFAFIRSSEFNQEVRKLNQKLAVTREIIEDVPFAVEQWQKVADERYPDGLPEPHSDDPSQWLFRGDIPSSTDPLQVALASLLGYTWPDQLDNGPHNLVDTDGIVTFTPLVNQAGVANRLRALLQAAYESPAPARPKGAPEVEEPRVWDESTLPQLLARTGSPGMSLEDWLRDKFFESHCKLFHQRPFLWHIWDGRKDGFHAIVNYHKLDSRNLDRLTHVYLGEWIERQKHASDAGDSTADARLIAAQELQKKLELIRTGEPPYDIFVRWKSKVDQPMGWDPDLNDGIRMNIRPFIEAGILRSKVNVNWNKDRGKDPKPNVSGTVERHNDLHFSLAEKRAAREEIG